jgi:hypothetical protein
MRTFLGFDVPNEDSLSSGLQSHVGWYSVTRLVEEITPQIIITPNMRLNASLQYTSLHGVIMPMTAIKEAVN